MSECRPLHAQSLAQDATDTAVVLKDDCESIEYSISQHPDPSPRDLYTQVLCDYQAAENFQRAFDRLQALWAQKDRLTSDLQLKVASGLGKTAMKLDKSPEEVMEYFKNALHVDQNDADSLCHYALNAVKAFQPSGEFDQVVLHAVRQPNLLASTKLCIAEYARLSSTLPDAQEIADASCRLFLVTPGTSATGWNCLKQNADHWDPEESRELRTQIVWQEEAYYSQVLTRNPKDKAAWHALKEIYDATDRLDQLFTVLETLTTLAETKDDQIAAWRERAQYAFHYKHFKEAEAAWGQLRDSDLPEFAYGMGMLKLVRDKDPGEALKLFKVASGFAQGERRFVNAVRLAMVAVMADSLATHDYVRLKGADTVTIFRDLKEKSLAYQAKFSGDRYGRYVFGEANWRVAEYDGDVKAMLVPDIFAEMEKAPVDELTDLDWVSLGLAYTHLGKIAESPDVREDAFKKAKDYFDRVEARRADVTAGGTALQRHNQIENRLSMGWMYFAKGEYSKAETEFSAFTETAWEGISVLPKQRVEAYRGLANAQDMLARAQMSAKNYVIAISLFEKALQNYAHGEALEDREAPKSPKINRAIDSSIVWGGDEVLEQELMTQLVAAKTQYLNFFDPHLRDESQFNKGVCQTWLGVAVKRERSQNPESKRNFNVEFEKAAAVFKDLLKKYPQQPEVARFLGSALLSMERVEEGREYMMSALQWGTAEPVAARASLIAAYQRRFDNTLADPSVAASDKIRIFAGSVEYLRLAVENAKENPASLDAAIQAAKRLSERPEIYCGLVGSFAVGFSEIMKDIQTSDRLTEAARNQLLNALKPCAEHALSTSVKTSTSTAFSAVQ